ncbi:MAG: hypothetical protein V4671_22925 [Armatimonadota bacterium]
MLIPILLLSLSVPALAAPPERPAPAISEAQEKAVLPVPVETIGFEQVPRLVPVQSGVDRKSQQRLLKEREQYTFPRYEVGPDGKPETMEMQYRRQQTHPDIKFDSGTFFSPSTGFPAGAVSVSGTRLLFTPEGRYVGDHETLWKWDVPKAFRKAHMIFQQNRVSIPNERFKPLLLQTASAHRLMLFDATKGLVWERDIQNLISGASGVGVSAGVSGGSEGQSLRFHVTGIGCSLDGSFMLVVINPQEATADVGVRLLVFDRMGKLISQRQIAGVEASNLFRNASGNSYSLSAYAKFENGKPTVGFPPTADLFLHRDGTVAGLFTNEDGSFVGYQVEVAGDDAIAISHSGLVFTLPGTRKAIE